MFFKAVVQAVIIFRSETRVLTPRTGRSLGIFQHGVERRITGRQINIQEDEGCEYPPLTEATEETGFE